MKPATQPPDRTPADPLALFRSWQGDAAASEAEGATAAVLATTDPDSGPTARVVLLKGCDDRGFVFYTNYESRKAHQLRREPRAALCFYWPSLGRQARIEGRVEPVPGAESDAYFTARPRGSQIGAWASPQSSTLAGRGELEARVAEIEARYVGAAVPRPPFWGGYLLRPLRIELWSGRPDRLHDRLLYERATESAAWATRRLYP